VTFGIDAVVPGGRNILKRPDSTHTKLTVFIVAILVAIAEALDPGAVDVLLRSAPIVVYSKTAHHVSVLI
jgi:hypothetical protein